MPFLKDLMTPADKSRNLAEENYDMYIEQEELGETHRQGEEMLISP